MTARQLGMCLLFSASCASAASLAYAVSRKFAASLVFAAILAFSTSLAFAANPAAPPAADLDEVLHLLQQRRHGEVSFVEQRFLSLLKRPQESSGELVYDAPNRLEKRTLEPHPATLLLDGNVLKEERGHHSRVIDLNAYPQVLPFVESVRATLAGDRATLERLFRLEFGGSLARWTLVLTPLDARAAKTVSQVLIDGSRDNLLKVEIRQPDGDRSLMTLRAHSDP